MILSSKEKKYAIVVGVLAVGFIVYELGVLPFQARLAEIETKTAAAQETLRLNSTAMQLRKRNLATWADLQASGLKSDESEADTQAIDAIYDWARAAGGDKMIETWRKDPPKQEGQFTVLEYHATVKGTTAQVSKLLWSIESAPIPVRVSDIAMTTAREGTDDLTLQMSVSTLFLTTADKTSEKPGGVAATRTGASVVPTGGRTTTIGGGK